MALDEESLLSAEPGDPRFAVWGDRLSELGDARGALVALCRDLEKSPADAALQRSLAALVEQHGETWCPGCIADELTLSWRDGFIDSITYSPPVGGEDPQGYGETEEDEDDEDEEEQAELPPGCALGALIDRTIAARLTRLSVLCPIDAEGNHGCWGRHTAFTEALVAKPRPWLRSLDFDGQLLPRPIDGRPQLSFLRFGFMHDADIEVGDLSPLWKRAPRLESLVIAQPQQLELGTIDAPSLRTLLVGSGAHLRPIAEGNLPALETLIVRVSFPSDVELLLRNPRFDRLRHLGLIVEPATDGGREIGDDVVRALVASPRLEQLASLDLGGLDASEAGWGALIDAAPRLGGLKQLRLTTWAPDPSVLETDDWLEESVEHFSAQRFRLRDQDVGKRLAQRFPVDWLVATMISFEAGADDALCAGLWGGSEGYAEQRPGPLLLQSER